MTWLWRHDDGLGTIEGWNAVRAEQAAEVTERMLLGAAGRARVEPTAAQRARRRVIGGDMEDTVCPDCGGPMTPRTSAHGKFWGCKSYPQCRGTRDSMGRAKADRDESDDRLPSDRWRENDRRRW